MYSLPSAVIDETRDHVFPTSWYPDTTPHEVQRWVAPSHLACNNDLGPIENKVFNRLALCIDPRKAEASGLSAKVMRSLGIGVEGLSDGEAAHRRKLKLGLINATMPYEPSIDNLPGLGLHAEFGDEGALQVKIPADLLIMVCKKIVRGCEWVLVHRIIEESFEILIYFVLDQNIPDHLAQAFRSPAAKDVHVGPGFRVIRVAAHDAPDSVAYKITLWGTLTFYALVLEAQAAVPL
jgi:hypothetical protein